MLALAVLAARKTDPSPPGASPPAGNVATRPPGGTSRPKGLDPRVTVASDAAADFWFGGEGA